MPIMQFLCYKITDAVDGPIHEEAAQVELAESGAIILGWIHEKSLATSV
ncbi:hypothetical protein KDI_10090 [Dictyobacter arantiisoli]|uniref:Uncharacterized protein n=1 Tax=Dictyobacter arantiisoli TaxID=2014874 RepID=A0A5A5T852_9CHLR|nr:hypothetical protein KDI_10090 [Dictyobacter arantiisoli]